MISGKRAFVCSWVKPLSLVVRWISSLTCCADSTAIYFSAIRILNHRNSKFMEKLTDFHNGCYTVSVTWLPGQSYNKVENMRVVNLERRIDKDKQHPSLSWALAYRVSKFMIHPEQDWVFLHHRHKKDQSSQQQRLCCSGIRKRKKIFIYNIY